LDTLERASNYKRGLERLDDAEKGVVRKLREVAGDLSKLVGNKRKHTFVIPESINNEVNQIRLEESYSMTSTCLTDYFSHIHRYFDPTPETAP
jgi:hypothetical protein